MPNDQVIYVSAGGAVHRCLSGEIGDGLPLGTYTGSATTAYTYDLTMLNADQFCELLISEAEAKLPGSIMIPSMPCDQSAELGYCRNQSVTT